VNLGVRRGAAGFLHGRHDGRAASAVVELQKPRVQVGAM
jgi:hypothetical protein